MKRLTSKQLLCKKKSDLFGKVLCFPTDTVYGVGTIIDAPIETVEVGFQRIYAMKQRDQRKALPVLIGSKADLEALTSCRSVTVRKLESLWPNALTIIYPKNKNLPEIITVGLETIALRMPNSSISLALLKKFGPIATTSINYSGGEPLNDCAEIEKEFGSQIDYIVIDEVVLSKVSSTIVSIDVDDRITILRQGDLKINQEDYSS